MDNRVNLACSPSTTCAIVTFTLGAALFAAGAFVGMLAMIGALLGMCR